MDPEQVIKAAQKRGIKRDGRADFTQPKEWLDSASGYLRSAQMNNPLVSSNTAAKRQADMAINTIKQAMRQVQKLEQLLR